ncbi:MAG: cell division protein FtsZ [Candidatus Muiribacteriota bacterium]
MFENIDFTDSMQADIKVAGIGGGGGNVVNMMIESNLTGVDFMALNTDAQVLANHRSKVKVQIGEKLTRGLGAGANPETGYLSMKQDLSSSQRLVEDTDLIFVVACLGGGTGSGAIIPFVEMCKKNNILTVAVVTRPFAFEGKRRKKIADESLKYLVEKADTTVVLSNDNLLGMMNRNQSLKDAFKSVDTYLSSNIKNIIEMINKPGIINLDFADVTTILKNSRLAVLGTGNAEGKNRGVEAVSKTIESPLLERDISNGSRVLLNITGPEDISLMEVNSIAGKIAEKVRDDAEIIFGAAVDPSLGKKLNISLLVSGFEE